MSEKDSQTQAVTISQQETVNRRTSYDAPPLYSEVITHDWIVRNNSRASSAQPYSPSRVLVTPNPAAHNSANNYGATTNTNITVVTTPLIPAPGEQQTESSEMQLQRYNILMLLTIVWLLLLFMLGTPLTLVCTVPALYHIHKVKHTKKVKPSCCSLSIKYT